MKPKARKRDYEPLNEVTTLAGASRLTHVDARQISLAIDTGHIAARREGRIVLVSVSSLLSYYHFRLNR